MFLFMYWFQRSDLSMFCFQRNAKSPWFDIQWFAVIFLIPLALRKKRYVPYEKKKKKKKREKKITNKSNWRHNKLYSPICIKDPAGLRNCSASKLPVLFVTTLIVLLNMPSPCWSCDSTMSSYSRPGDRFVITASDVSRERILSVRHSGKSTALYLRDFFHVQ